MAASTGTPGRLTTRISAAAVVTLALTAVPSLAHHTAAYTYDVEKPASLTGTVSEVEWKQPHVIVYVDVKDSGGAFVNWVVEMAGPQGGMYRRGVRPENFVKPGDAISMTVCVAKDGSHAAAARSVSVPAGLEGKVGIC